VDGQFDGKDYPVTDSSTDTRSYKKVNDHTLTFTNKKGDKVTISGRGVVSADGKTRTVTITGTDSKGTKLQALRCTTSSRGNHPILSKGYALHSFRAGGQEFSPYFLTSTWT